MQITDEEAKEALDAGKMLLFNYPQQRNYLAAKYRAYKSRTYGYVCDVHYQYEEKRRKPQWGNFDFAAFVKCLPRPVALTDEWKIQEQEEEREA